MTMTLKTTLVAGLLTVLPFMAQAATVNLASVDVSLTQDTYDSSYTVAADEDGVIFNFTVLEDLNIPMFKLSSLTAGGSMTTMYEISKARAGPSSFGIATSTDTMGTDIIPGADYAAGEAFQVIFTENTRNPITYTVAFSTTSISPVPVPAAGFLLMSVLGGAMALRRRTQA